jgi:hypothetical protein
MARRAERQIEVEGTPQQCFDALTDFGTYPHWQEAVKACAVETRDRQGRGRRVQFQLEAELNSISYTLDYSYEEPHLVAWDFVEGDVGGIDGEFVLEERGDGTTLATYALRIEPGMWMPDKIALVLRDRLMEHSVENLKARVEEPE